MNAASAAGFVAGYERDGYAFPLDVLAADAAAGYLDRIEAAERDFAHLPLDRYLKNNVHIVLPVVDELMRLAPILDAVEAILGPDLLVWGCTLFTKEPASASYVSWHQDLTYWGLDSIDEVTAWLALTPATTENGAMRFVPGSHRREIVDHRDTFEADNMLTRGQEIAVEVDEDEAVDVVLAAGQMSLHHGRMFHSSRPNVSERRRVGVAVRYIAPHVRQVVGARDYAALVRGADRYGHFVPVPSPAADFAPEALGFYEETHAAQNSYLYVGAEG